MWETRVCFPIKAQKIFRLLIVTNSTYCYNNFTQGIQYLKHLKDFALSRLFCFVVLLFLWSNDTTRNIIDPSNGATKPNTTPKTTIITTMNLKSTLSSNWACTFGAALQSWRCPVTCEKPLLEKLSMYPRHVHSGGPGDPHRAMR